MEENIFLVVDYNTACRLCLQTNGLLTNLFGNDQGTLLVEQIFHLTGIQFTEDDGLPSNICNKCRNIVERSRELRETALQAHRLLVNAVKSLDLFLNVSDVNLENGEEYGINRENKKFLNHMKTEKKEDFLSKRVPYDDAGQDGSVKKRAPKELQCQICLNSFENKQQVAKHVAVHYANSTLTSYLQMKRPYECEICDSGNLRKKELIAHHRKHLNVNPYVCKHPGCEYVGKNQDTLRQHRIIHGSRSQICDKCGARFRRRWEVRQHAMRRHGAAPTACRECRAVCRNPLAARAHVATHHRKLRFPCGWRGCPKAFPSAHAHAAHRRAHAAERRYSCALCAAAYTSQSLLNRHSRLHERARVSKCDKCARAFEDYAAFHAHRVAAHGPWQPHRCQACNTGYQSEAQLEKHISQCELAAVMRAYDDDPDDPAPVDEDTLDDGPVCEDYPQNGAIPEDAEVQIKGNLENGMMQQHQTSYIIKTQDLAQIPAEDGNDQVVQEVDGLLYIEVGSGSDCDVQETWTQ